MVKAIVYKVHVGILSGSDHSEEEVSAMCDDIRDSDGISKLTKIQLILPYEIC